MTGFIELPVTPPHPFISKPIITFTEENFESQWPEILQKQKMSITVISPNEENLNFEAPNSIEWYSSIHNFHLGSRKF